VIEKAFSKPHPGLEPVREGKSKMTVNKNGVAHTLNRMLSLLKDNTDYRDPVSPPLKQGSSFSKKAKQDQDENAFD
jgi:hypothetical protein